MASPIISIMNADNTKPVTEWYLGTLRTGTTSKELEINVWNNKGGSVDVSDLVDVKVTTVDENGVNETSAEEAVRDKWTQALVYATAPVGADGAKQFVAIGANSYVGVASNGAAGDDLTNHVIKGTANDGTVSNSTTNFANIRVRVVPALNASKDVHNWRLKIQGYFS